MPRYVYRPSLLWTIFRWSAAVAALYLTLYFLSYLFSHFGPFLVVAGLIYGAVFVVRRGRGR
ncbi:hypothetical protein [Pseudofrankia asymbiotica]|uniref:hypothetical protein n=1 Tax=Pseudofrankia asymbiotica TaxID=1834516 RepID=UPI00097617C0|nr:hypothetical protein [Pseudofrankia asymbiotica]